MAAAFLRRILRNRGMVYMSEYSIALMIESNRCDRRFNNRRATKEQINMRVEMKAEGELKTDRRG